MTRSLTIRLRPLVAALGTAFGLSLAAAPAMAQNWPERTIRIIAPSTPGGAADLFARQICDHFSEVFKQPCVVDNRAGAGGMIGTQAAAQADPDGYTFTISSLAYHVIAPATATKATYDPLKDFTHVAYIGGPPNVFVTSAKSDLRSVKDALEAARKNPPLLFVSPGFGTLGHLLVEVLAAKEGVKTQLVLTQGAAQARADLAAGTVNFGTMTWSSALPQIKSKAVIPVGHSGEKRLDDYPDVPTFREMGRDDLTTPSWFALSAPAGVPQDIVKRANAEVAKMLEKPKVQQVLANSSIQTRTMSPEEFTAFVEAETKRWVPLAQKLLQKKN